MKKKNLAFTLAEVLIVIGIIGVVAALTLPNLNHATGDKEKVTKVKKIYSALTEAFDRAQVIYGDYDTWYADLSTGAEKSERFAKRVTEFMKVSKDCGYNKGCFSEAPLILSNGSILDENYLSALQHYNTYMVTLSDGVSLGFLWELGGGGYSHIRVDIDGPNKGKNQSGNDIFNFSIFFNDNSANEAKAKINQLYPSLYHYANDLSPENFSNYQYETAWVIENGNLDYLKCPDELNWETQTSCK